MNILEMNHVSKTFGSSRVLSDIHLSVGEGEIHALLGENGAGKSTLMNILTGVIPADAGEIVFCGKSYPTPTIHQMEAAGIAFVHQELNVINDLTVADNIFLRRELTRFGLLNNKEQVAKTKQLFEELGVDIDPNAMVSELKTSEKQLLEICRALYADAKLLILDEPTTALSNNEIDHLFDILRKLKTQGKSFIFISHKMPEIFAVADRYTVLRNGEFISSGNIKDTDPHAITSDMVGTKYVDAEVYEPRELGGPLLTLHGLSGDGFENIDLTVRRGEIVCLAGIDGNGQTEFVQGLTGLDKITGGTVELCGKNITHASIRRRGENMSHIPEDRHKHGLILDFTLEQNMVLQRYLEPQFQKAGFIRNAAVREYAQHLIDQYDVRSGQGPVTIARSMSGGNQQKAIIAREVDRDKSLIVAVQPTRGLDVGAIEYIHSQLVAERDRGKAVLLVSLELDEVMSLSDRILVMYEGQLVGQLNPKTTTVAELGLYMSGAKRDDMGGDQA